MYCNSKSRDRFSDFLFEEKCKEKSFWQAFKQYPKSTHCDFCQRELLYQQKMQNCMKKRFGDNMNYLIESRTDCSW